MLRHDWQYKKNRQAQKIASLLQVPNLARKWSNAVSDEDYSPPTVAISVIMLPTYNDCREVSTE